MNNGDYLKRRKWYGNNEFVVNWGKNGKEIKERIITKYPYLKGNTSLVLKESNPYFEELISWTYLTSKGLSAGYYEKVFLFDVSGHSVIDENEDKMLGVMGF